MLNVVLRLRRDNDYNYEKIKNTFIPAKGEVCLVDTAKYGLRAVCGDGYSTFAELDYMDGAIVQGYYSEGIFYKDKELTEQLTGSEARLYFNLNGKNFYYFHENTYTALGTNYVHANESNPGIMKLYTTTGSNEDGTMTQKAITKELSEKVEMALNIEEELLIFDTDLN